MNKKPVFAVISTVLMSATGLVFAGPGEKNTKVVIEHTPPSDNNHGPAFEDGSVELEVSVPAAIAHITNHDGDCVVSGGGDLFTEEEQCGGIVAEIVE
jgi:dihydrofolate reductase